MEILPPVKGIFRGGLSGHAPELTTEIMNNVRPRDTAEKKIRIGQRPGLAKWGAGNQVGGVEQPVVFITSVTSVI